MPPPSAEVIATPYIPAAVKYAPVSKSEPPPSRADKFLYRISVICDSSMVSAFTMIVESESVLNSPLSVLPPLFTLIFESSLINLLFWLLYFVTRMPPFCAFTADVAKESKTKTNIVFFIFIDFKVLDKMIVSKCF